MLEHVKRDYKLGTADKLRILVYNQPTLSGEFFVNANGLVSFPLIGDIQAAGHTTGEIGREIAYKLSDGYLKSPQVSIDVINFRPFFILGEVNTPGQYPYVSGMTVLQAVAAAGGFTFRADKRLVLLRHQDGTQEQKYDITPGMMIVPGDTIRITERYF